MVRSHRREIPLLKWLSRSKRQSGTMAIAIESRSITFAHAQRLADGRPLILDWGQVEWGADTLEAQFVKLAKDKGMGGIDCTTLLDPADYQFLLVEAPNVPREELKSAIRWKIKD